MYCKSVNVHYKCCRKLNVWNRAPSIHFKDRAFTLIRLELACLMPTWNYSVFSYCSQIYIAILLIDFEFLAFPSIFFLCSIQKIQFGDISCSPLQMHKCATFALPFWLLCLFDPVTIDQCKVFLRFHICNQFPFHFSFQSINEILKLSVHSDHFISDFAAGLSWQMSWIVKCFNNLYLKVIII